MKRIQRFKIQPIKFLLAWVAANLLGGFLVGYLEEKGWQFMATLVFSGAIIGSLQWTVLRWLGIRNWWWPLASAIGWIWGIHLSIGLQPAVNCLVNGLWHQFGMGEVFWLNLINLPVWLSFMAILQGCLLSCHTRFRARSFRIWMLASWLGAAVKGAIGAWLCQLMCQVLPKALIGLINGTGWAAFRYHLKKIKNFKELEEQLNLALKSRLPKGLKKKKQSLAIDRGWAVSAGKGLCAVERSSCRRLFISAL